MNAVSPEQRVVVDSFERIEFLAPRGGDAYEIDRSAVALFRTAVNDLERPAGSSAIILPDSRWVQNFGEHATWAGVTCVDYEGNEDEVVFGRSERFPRDVLDMINASVRYSIVANEIKSPKHKALNDIGLKIGGAGIGLTAGSLFVSVPLQRWEFLTYGAGAGIGMTFAGLGLVISQHRSAPGQMLKAERKHPELIRPIVSLAK